MEFYKRELAKEDDREILREKTIQYYTTGKGKGSWMYLQQPEEIYEDPEYGRAMEDLYFTDNVGEDDIESLVYMRRHVDPVVTAKQMKLCSDFLTDYSFEEFRSIDTMTAEQCAYLKKLIAEIEKGEKELYEYIPEAEEFFGKSHPLYVSSEQGMTI